MTLLPRQSDSANPWPATDGLGRTLPSFEDVGPIRANRQVAVFYFLWHHQHSTSGPHDITQILAKHPGAMQDSRHPAWGPLGDYHHFAEPLLGYYRSTDEWVYRKHAEMLADAGVDVIIFDCSNGFTYPQSYRVLCRAFNQAQQDGVDVPRIAFLCRFAPDPDEVAELDHDLYAPGLFSNLWFRWDNKPLIMAYPDGASPEIRQFFTFRAPMPTYFDPPSRDDQWGWLQRHPQHGFGGSASHPEQMPVGVAMNAVSNALGTLSHPQSMGRSYHQGRMDLRPHAYRYGLNFQEQWDHALTADPELIFITGWNEWVAMRMQEFNGYRAPVVFVDQFDIEHSRDIEPMRGGYQDHYYYQMIANIRRYKGMHKPATAGVSMPISIDGQFSDWDDVELTYADYRGDTGHRDHPGWGSDLHYQNQQGRNDIVAGKVSHDRENLYFQVRTAAPLTDPGAVGWMQLLIDTDRSAKTGWAGYDFVLNPRSANQEAVLERRHANGNGTLAARVPFRLHGTQMELAIPRAALHLPMGTPIDIEFKWVDHVNQFDDVMEFYICGDAAPGGRFNYWYREQIQ